MEINILKKMIEIRAVEIMLGNEKKAQVIKGPVHLSVGQEAIPSALGELLTKADMVFSAHRSHGHFLAMGCEPYDLFAEVLCKRDGASGGMGGSMHLWGGDQGFHGSTPIVSGTVPLALGGALALKIKNSNSIAVAYLGDGAMEEGVVHECLNFASVYSLPILFVVENNLYASHMHISERQPSESLVRFAEANNIESRSVDGNDAIKIFNESKILIDYIRENSAPGFIEAKTYRWYGHVDWREDIDVGLTRSMDELNWWKRKDPIGKLAADLISLGHLSEIEYLKIQKEVNERISEAWGKALSAPNVDPDAMTRNVYA